MNRVLERLGHLRMGRGSALLQLLAWGRIRSLARVVYECDRAASGLIAAHRVHAHAQVAQALQRALPDLVAPERREQQRLARQPRQLHRRHRAAAGGLLECVLRVHDLARARRVGNPSELHPLDVANHR